MLLVNVMDNKSQLNQREERKIRNPEHHSNKHWQEPGECP
jgi:hypothetical protein